MYYFLNPTVTVQQSGVGHAEIKRFQLFKSFNKPVKILTTNFDMSLTKGLEASGVDNKSSLNLFDFFGDMEGIASQKFTVADLNIDKTLDVQPTENNMIDVLRGAERKMQIVLRDDGEQFDHVSYFDTNKRLVEVDWWDPRGFKSLQQIYDRSGSARVERAFNNKGKLFYETYHFGKEYDKIDNSSYRIIDYKGVDWDFNSTKQLATFFFDEVTKRDRERGEHTVIVNDASFELSWSLLHMKENAFVAMQLHSNHTNDPIETLHSGINFNYEYALNNFKKWDAMIAPTETQATNLRKRFGDNPETFVVPVGVVSDDVLNAPKQDFDKRTPGKIVMIARLSHEKRIDHAIKAFAKALEKVPGMTLDIYGYANDKSGDIAKKLVKDLNLTKAVSFMGYTQDINAVYDQAQLSILTSEAEGLPLSLIEAQSHGVPLASYDINYGPRDVINDGKDGLLVEAGNIDAMGDAIAKIMGDDELRRQFSETAYESRMKYSKENVWKQWQIFDQGATKYFESTEGGNN
ncbi:glycosyltransferase [Lentilactobacillus sp. Marseille-Q4993]|uniref:glycosyltransferase n=1 Tax=Lentilactobacillus sp. Marseille-Q4993 TaxID=3039492 RepID=UPI0024BC46B2|nr:glycosyltransferase [Lentilactobacillus sp. Marseille-Q4993]